MTPLFALALLAAQGAPAATDGAAVLRRAGMSAAGVAAVQRSEPLARADVARIAPRARAAQEAVQRASASADVDAMERAMRSLDTTMASFASARTTRLIAVLRTLSPADRRIFLRSMSRAPAARTPAASR